MIKGLLSTLSICFLLVLGTGVAQAAAPANDAFAAAAQLAVGAQVSSDNLDATAEPGEPNAPSITVSGSCAAISDGPNCGTSAWYVFETPVAGEYTIETCDRGTDVDTVLAIYTGASIGALAPVGNNDDKCAGGYENNGSQVSFAAVANTAYHVDVAGYRGDQGSFYLRAYAGPPQIRPEPDTGIDREGSFLEAIDVEGNGFGMLSGPRHSPSFRLDSSVADAGFECALDGAAFTACSSPVSYSGLAPGSSHSFAARASSAGSVDPTPVIERFTIDTTAPDTTLISGPVGNLASQEGTWKVASSERNNSSTGFHCGIDSLPSFSCRATETIKALCQGPHTFRAAAWSRGANIDPTPIVAEVNVTTGPVCAPPTLGEVKDVGTIEPTRANIEATYDDKGAGGVLHVDYGPTDAYGMTVRDQPLLPGATPGTANVTLPYLTPGAVYHYRVTITTPFGQATSPDQTVTAAPLGGSLPTVQNGPVTVGEYAARIGASIDPTGQASDYFALVSTTGPVTSASAFIFGKEIETGFSEIHAVGVDVADLAPATTYHYRVGSRHDGTDSNEVLGPEGTFTTPPFAVPAASATAAPKPVKPHFKLSKKSVSIGKLTRSSTKLTVKVRKLPAGTVMTLKLKAGKAAMKAKKAARKSGSVLFTVKLSRKLRKALRSPQVKKVKIDLIASPPGDTVSKVTLKRRLKPLPKG
jgi:hypothetical protein